jgi:integrase
MGRGSPLKDAVAKIDLPYVQAFKDRHGRLRHYYRRPGYARLPLPGVPGSAEFMEAYKAADARAKPKAVDRVQPRSINALVVEYYRSAEWRDLRDSTKLGYRNHLDRFRDRHGNKGVAGIQTHHLEAIFHGMADTPGAAANLRKRLRRLFRLAVRLGWRADNPVTETEIRRKKTAGFTPWTEAEIEAFEEHWPSGSRERLAMALLLYTGQRRSDVVTMGRQHVSAGRVAVKQLKTDNRLKIPLHRALKAEIEAAPLGMTFLITHQGKPFTSAGFTQWFVERAVMAGIKDRSPHGLRKAAGRRLAEAGCTAKQIAAILGHSTLSEVERYTRDADQQTLADEAMAKLEAKT